MSTGEHQNSRDFDPQSEAFRIRRNRRYLLDGWLIIPNRNSVEKEGKTTRLQLKIMQVLLLLIDNAGKTVSKDELHKKVWPDVVITDHSINRAISHLRKLFGDDPKEPRIIETIPKIGYRLLCSVDIIEDKESAAETTSTEPGEKVGKQRRPNPFYLLLVLILIAVIISLFWFGVRYESNNNAISEHRPIPLTTQLGHERFISFGGQDSLLVYTHKHTQSSQWDIFLERKGDTPENLTNSPARESYPRFSPTRNEIAFVENGPDSLYIKIMTIRNREIRPLKAFRKLHEINYTIFGMDWSPNGEELALALKVEEQETVQIFTLNLKSAMVKPLFSDSDRKYRERYPAYSNDGRHLAFARTDEKGFDNISIVDLASGKTTQLTVSDENVRGIDWDPQVAERLVYFAEKNGVYSLKKVDLDGYGQTVFTPLITGAVCLNPQFNEAGDLLTFENITFSTNIYELRMDEDQQIIEEAKPVVTSTYNDWQVEVSSDGSMLVFLSNRSGENRVWVSNSDGSDSRMACDVGIKSSGNAVWSPDMKEVYFSGKQGDSYNIIKVDILSGAYGSVIKNASHPRFSKDGEWLYFSKPEDGKWQIWKKLIKTGKIEQVTTHQGYAAMESPDGRGLFINKMNSPGLWKIDPNGNEELIISDASTQNNLNWVVAEKGIYYIKLLPNKTPQIVFFSFKDQSEKRLNTELLSKTHLLDGLSLSPDGNCLYFSIMDHSESDILKIHWP